MSRDVNTSRGREAVQPQATKQPARANKRLWRIKSKVAPAAQLQWLKQQKQDAGGGFSGQLVVVVTLVAALAMASAEQWPMMG